MDTLTDENALKEEDESGAELLIPQPDRLQLSFERITAIGTLCSVNDVTEGISKESPMGASWVIPRKLDKMV